MYRTGDSDRIAYKIYNYIKKTTSSDSLRVTLKQTLCTDEKFVRASWVSIMIVVFVELTGFQAIMLYSNSIFTQILGSEGGITPRQGTFMIATVNFVASFISVVTVRLLGRRSLLLFGHLAIALCHVFIGAFIVLDVPYGVLFMTCLYMFLY